MVRFALLSVVFATTTLSALAQLGSGIYQIQDYKGRLLTMNDEGAPCTVQRTEPDSKKWEVTLEGDTYTLKSVKTETFAGYTGSEHGDFVKNLGSQSSEFVLKQVVEGSPDGLYYISVPNTDLVVAPDERDPFNTIPNVRLEEPDDPAVPEPKAVWTFTESPQF